jgi:imidazole glycerol-phosphate synthase subunit HisH
MQLLGLRSEEGSETGLGWITARSLSLRNMPGCEKLRVPHMGWNLIEPIKSDPIIAGLHADARFYFVHSYHVCCDCKQDAIATTNYGLEFVSILRRGNIWGAQFHPEKSHRFGMRLLSNFAGLE